MKCFLAISNFLEEISSLPYSSVLLCFFALITEEGFLISPCYSSNYVFKWIYLSFSPFLYASLLFSAICNASSDNHFVVLLFFFLRDGFDHHLLYNVTNLCPYFFRSSVYQIIPWIYLSPPLYNFKGFDLGHT